MGGGVPSVYRGFWIDHSRGNNVLGATLTLKEAQATNLLNFLTILVTTAGQSFWIITSYALHQRRCRQSPQKALFYQQQAVVRNSGSALTAALRLIQLSFNWRAPQPLARRRQTITISDTPFLVFIALSVSIGFALAGIFSNQVTSSANAQILLKPNVCGFFQDRDTGVPENARSFLRADADAASYAERCYNGSSRIGCNIYVQKSIQSNKTYDDQFPFAQMACSRKDKPYRMTTALMDSNDVLGINAKYSDRLQVLKVATCSPINLAPYFIQTNVSKALADRQTQPQQVERYYFGTRCDPSMVPTVKRRSELASLCPSNDTRLGKGVHTPSCQDASGDVSTNFTYEHNIGTQSSAPGYDLKAVHAEVGREFPDWFPIPDFARTDADVTLFMLGSNDVKYINPNNDSFLNGMLHSRVPVSVVSGQPPRNVTIPTRAISSIGCIDQYQICKPVARDGKHGLHPCTQLGPSSTLQNHTRKLGLNPTQNATLAILAHWLTESGIYNSVSTLGSAALLARRTAYVVQDNFVQTSEQNELHWQDEVASWFNASLASLQMNLIQMVVERPYTGSEWNHGNTPRGFRPLEDPQELDICKRQTTKGLDGYQNFSTVGIIILIAFSGLLIILSLYIHVVGGRLQHVFFDTDYPKSTWNADGYLQLQRQAYEGVGYDGWEQCGDEDVPIIRNVDTLNGLDLSDIHHPRLGRKPSNFEYRPDSESQKHVQPPAYDYDTQPRISSLSFLEVRYPSFLNRPLPPVPLESSNF